MGLECFNHCRNSSTGEYIQKQRMLSNTWKYKSMAFNGYQLQPSSEKAYLLPSQLDSFHPVSSGRDQTFHISVCLEINKFQSAFVTRNWLWVVQKNVQDQLDPGFAKFRQSSFPNTNVFLKSTEGSRCDLLCNDLFSVGSAIVHKVETTDCRL